MAYAEDRCPECRQEIEFRYVPALGKSRAFDPTRIERSGDPLARWAEYNDRRTGALFARRLATGDQPAPDEHQIRLHRAACPAVTRNNHDS